MILQNEKRKSKMKWNQSLSHYGRKLVGRDLIGGLKAVSDGILDSKFTEVISKHQRKKLTVVKFNNLTISWVSGKIRGTRGLSRKLV